MDVVPLGPGFAAELRGVALADVAHDDAAYRAVRAAFEQHSVLVFRDQDVTDDSQIAFSRRFGPLEITPAATQGAGTHLVILSTIGPDGKVVPADSRVALRNKANQLWHADSTFKSVPALASVLSARIIPSHGGETEYVSTRLAFDRFDKALQERVASLFAWHDYSYSRGKVAPNIVAAEERAALPPQCWRMVWTNPANGARALYIASHAYAIEGMEESAAQKLIAELTDAATASGLSYTHVWRQGDVLMWDNSRNASSRPAVAAERGAAHRAHHHFGDRCRRLAKRAAARAPGGRVARRRREITKIILCAALDRAVAPQFSLPTTLG